MERMTFIKRFFMLVGLVALQALLLNKIALFGYVTPLFYIWMVLRFDSAMSRNTILLWSFFLGLAVDMFTGTVGLNAASATLLGMFQPLIFKLFMSLDRYDVVIPNSSSMGGRSFIGYITLSVLLHHTCYFILKSIPLSDWTALVVKVLLSSLLTLIMILVVEYSFGQPSVKRSASR